MNDASTAVQSAEQRVVRGRANFLAQVDLLETRARRLTTSPLIIGGVIAVTAVTASLILTRRGKPRPPALPPRSGNRLLTLLKAAQVSMALSAAVAGFNAARTGARQAQTGHGCAEGGTGTHRAHPDRSRFSSKL
jgi:hypothetical protein